jgi:hypothetical protein
LTGTTNASRPAHTSSLLGDQADGRWQARVRKRREWQ